MSNANIRTTYSKWSDEFYTSTKGSHELQPRIGAYDSSIPSKTKDEVLVVTPKETKLHSSKETVDISYSVRKSEKSEIVTYKISPFPSRYSMVEGTREKFYRLCRIWKRETQHMSCPEDMILHPAYLKIIGLGPSAIPLILAELEKKLDFWFWALDAISDENPVPDDVQGDMERTRLAWIQWGYENAHRFGPAVFGRVV